MTRVWTRHRLPYSWRQGDGPWNSDEVELYYRGLLGWDVMEGAARARHPDAELSFHTAWNEDQKPDFRPPADLVFKG